MNRRAVAIILLPVLFGCGPKSALVGTWKSTTKNGPVTYEFTNDGTVNRTYNVNEMRITMVGKYQLKGRSLSVTQTDVWMEGGPDGDFQLSEKGKAATKELEPEKWSFSLVDKDKLQITEQDGLKVFLTRG